MGLRTGTAGPSRLPSAVPPFPPLSLLKKVQGGDCATAVGYDPAEIIALFREAPRPALLPPPPRPSTRAPHPSLSLQEVVVLAAAAGYDPAEVIALFKEADTNKDAVISFEEFIQLMRNSYID